jgi:hypothetical protein
MFGSVMSPLFAQIGVGAGCFLALAMTAPDQFNGDAFCAERAIDNR